MSALEISANATELLNKNFWFIGRFIRGLKQAVEDQATEIRNQTLHELIDNNNSTLNLTTLNRSALTENESNFMALTLNYFVSPYAGACMTMAIVLNRTIVFASSRSSPRLRNSNPLNKLGNSTKILLRLLTIGLLLNTLWHVILQYSYINRDLFLFIKEFYQYRNPIQSVSSSLWEVFLSLCISQFIETLVSITSGQSPSNDSGLTLFEYSLAFQEAQFQKRPNFLVLTIVMFALANQIVNQLSGVFQWKKFQLVPSTILGVGFLGFSIYSLVNGYVANFPIVVFFSIIPQIIVLGIILFCLAVYGVAVLLNGTTEGLTYTPMIRDLKNSLNLQLNDDFNSVIMRFGFIMFTAVDNEEYVNELSDLNLIKKTYLEAEGSGHFISRYFNDFGTNPELVLDKKRKLLDAKVGLNENNNKITNVYSFLRKYVNLGKLLQSLYILIKKSFFKAKYGTKSPVSKLPTPERAPIIGQEIEEVEAIELEDDSEDFRYESESDTDPLEYDSEIEDYELENEYIPNLAAARQREAPTTSSVLNPTAKTRAIDELFSTDDVLQLISPKNIEDASYLNSLKTHLIRNERLTRSKYVDINQDDLLKEVILSQRPVDKLHLDDPLHLFCDFDKHEESDKDSQEPEDVPCVVCQTNRRSIILWPCKCLAICENCRLNLGVRGFKICVCCRRQVDGFSKIYIP